MLIQLLAARQSMEEHAPHEVSSIRGSFLSVELICRTLTCSAESAKPGRGDRYIMYNVSPGADPTA